MNQKKVHAIFDIGKTNKKLFLFDESGTITWKTSTTFPTVKDDDGFPSDDLLAIEQWMITTMKELVNDGQWQVTSINFSGYGASIVFLDEHGEKLPIFINYLKPYPEDLTKTFFEKYGPIEKFCQETASPHLGMLNSGMQIYWLKYYHPNTFKKVRYVLHFPQYLSYLFTQIPLAEYTSIGCHTGMWDFSKNDYHHWIDEEQIRQLLPTIKPSDTWMQTRFENQLIQVGTGLHDTSASLIPYLTTEKEPFILLSTGTWALSVNPFSRDELSKEDLKNDCLNFLRIDGNLVRTARLFLGREHEIQVKKLSKYYEVDQQKILSLKWDNDVYNRARKHNNHSFEFEHLQTNEPEKDKTNFLIGPDNWILAYYQLMDRLVSLQIEAIKRAVGNDGIKRLIIEGGFVHNKIFVKLLGLGLPGWKVSVSNIKGGSARGVFELVHP